MATARKRGDKYRVRIYVGKDENGKGIYRSITANTKREAERLAAQVRIDNTYREDITFGEAMRRYIESKANTLSPSTIAGYEKIRRNHIVRVRDLRISRLTNEDLQRQLDDLASTHSPKTVDNARALFVPVMKMFSPEFSLHLTTPAKEKKQKIIPTDAQLSRLLDLCSDPMLRLSIMLAAFCSLRISEISGLFADCIHDKSVSIRRVMIQNTDGVWVIKDHPKSFAGYRDIFPPPEVMSQLKALSKESDQPVITYTPAQIRSRFETLRGKAGCNDISFHSLRHYFATYCHSKNIPDKTIAKMGGWESMETLQRIYQHSTAEKENELSSLMNDHYKQLTREMLETKENG